MNSVTETKQANPNGKKTICRDVISFAQRKYFADAAAIVCAILFFVLMAGWFQGSFLTPFDGELINEARDDLKSKICTLAGYEMNGNTKECKSNDGANSIEVILDNTSGDLILSIDSQGCSIHDPEKEGAGQESRMPRTLVMYQNKPLRWDNLGARMFFDVGTAVKANAQLVARFAETCVLNTKEAVWSNQVKLCNGTVQKLPPNQCTRSSQLFSIESGNTGFTKLLNKLSSATLLQLGTGAIQYLTIALGIYCIVHLPLRNLRFVGMDIEAYREYLSAEIADSQSKEGKSTRLILQPHPACEAIYQAVLHEMHEMRAKLIRRSTARDSPVDESFATSIHRLGGTWERAKASADAYVNRYLLMADFAVKLSFIGTIIGIALALFSAGDLDSADTIKRIQAKFQMYGSLATAFGTTLVGVLVSIAITVMVHREDARSGEIIKNALRQGEEQITRGKMDMGALEKFSNTFERSRTSTISESNASWKGIIGISAIILVVLWVYWRGG